MTQYLLAVHGDGSNPYEGLDVQEVFSAVEAFNEGLRADGSWVFAGGLMPVETASVVDGQGTDVLVTDGPFLETKEHMGGFWVVEAPDLDAAIKIAAAGSKACLSPVEVRPFQAE